MRRGVAFALLLTAEIAAVAARGDEPTRPLVALLRPDPPDPALGQMFVRIEGELSAAGFDVTIVPRAPDEAPQAAIERASETHTPAAVIGVFRGVSGMELWVADQLTGRSVVRHLNASGESGTRASEILAIRAADQLSASLIDLDLAPKPAAPTPEAAPNPSTTKPGPTVGSERATERSRFRAQLGIGTLFSFEGASPTVTPVGRLSWAPLPSWEIRMTGAGLGTRSSVTSASGSATFSQDLLLVEGVFSPTKFGMLGPRASLGVGTLHVGVDGRGSGSVQGLDTSKWAPAVDAGVGLSYRRAARMGFALEGHAVFASPYPVVRLLDETHATMGRPTIFATAALTGDL